MKTLLLLVFPFIAFSQTLTVKNPLRFLALGDSYTIGQSVSTNERWPVQLKDSLALRGIVTQTLKIIATTGWRTDDLLNAVTGQNLQAQNFNFVSVLIGVNNQYQNKAFSQYKTEFIALMDSALRYAGGQNNQVFVVSIPDYAYTPYGQSTSNPALITQQIAMYNVYNKHIADSMKIQYFNITPISQQGLNIPSYVAGDGLHPSGAQYSQWVKLMLQEIDKVIVSGIRKSEKKSETEISITPNPFTDRISIRVPELQTGETASYEVLDVTGKTVTAGSIKMETTDADLSALPSGLYFIKIKSVQGQLIKRIVKAR